MITQFLPRTLHLTALAVSAIFLAACEDSQASLWSVRVYYPAGLAFGDPHRNRTDNLLIKRYLGLSAVAHRVEVRAKRVQLSCETAVVFTAGARREKG